MDYGISSESKIGPSLPSSTNNARDDFTKVNATLDSRTCLPYGWQTNQPLGVCMLKLLDAQLGTDVSFRCADQHQKDLDDRIRAHKVVLTARSPVFEAMFFGTFKDENDIHVLDADKHTFQTFIRLLYCDNLNLPEDFEDIVCVLDIAHKYQVQTLEDGCCQKLVEKTTIDNACFLLERALLYENTHLRKPVIDFIDKHAGAVLATDGFLKTSLRCLTYIVKGDTFYVTETDLLNRVMEWAKYNGAVGDDEATRTLLGDAFYHLRRPLVSTTTAIAGLTRQTLICTKDGFEVFQRPSTSIDKIAPMIADIASRNRVPPDVVCSSPNINIVFPSDMRLSSMMTESVLITPNVYVHLTDIHLNHHVKANLDLNVLIDDSKHRLVDGVYRQIKLNEWMSVSEEISIRNLTLSVDVQIGGEFLVKDYRFRPNTELAKIKLRESRLLSSGRSYELSVYVRVDGIDNLRLKHLFWREPQSFATTSSDIVTVQTRKWSPAKLIRDIFFKCISNRD